MAETTITGLPNASALTGAERVPMDQAGVTVDASTQAIANLAPGTDLEYTAGTRTLGSSTGADVVLPEATTTVAGLMSGTDKTKLDGIASGATANVAADAAPQALAATAAIGTSTDYAREDHVHQRDTDVIVLACSDETTALTTGTNKVRFWMPFAATLVAVRANVNTAPTGSTLIVDINEAGTSVLGTKLSIDASETTSTTAASAATITDSSLADDAEISIDIDQIGSTVAGAGLKVALVVRRS